MTGNNLLVFIIILVYALGGQEVQCITEEIEATPTNTNGFELGELSMPQYVLMLLIFLKLVLLYAAGILPIEIDLGAEIGLYPFDYYSDYEYQDEATGGRSQGIGGRSLHSSPKKNKLTSLHPLLYDCPLQYICEVDHWANQSNHDNLVEGYIASWFRSDKPSIFSSGSQAREFAGVPDTCSEMYPCPFDIQKAVGVAVPTKKSPAT